MLDLAGLANKAGFKASERSEGKKEYVFEFLGTYQLEDGTFRFRILPSHPDKNPDGARLCTHHGLLVNPLDKPQKILCNKNRDENERCVFCEICETLEEKPDEVEALKPYTKKAIDTMKPWYKYQLATTWFVEKTKAWSADGEKEYTAFKPGKKEFGKIFEVSMSTATIHGTIQELIAKYKEKGRDITDLNVGSYLLFHKQGKKYRIEVDPDGDGVPLENQVLMKDYPDLMKFGKYVDDMEAEAMIESCKFYKDLKGLVEFE